MQLRKMELPQASPFAIGRLHDIDYTGRVFCCRQASIYKSRNPHYSRICWGFRPFLYAWQCPTFTRGNPALSSALSVFTSEFEMDSGGSHSLWPPGKLAGRSLSCPTKFCSSDITKPHIPLINLLGCYMIKPHGQLVRVSLIHYCTSTSRLSTS